MPVKMVVQKDNPPLRVRRFHRPGAPKAGIMTYARIGGDWLQVGWVRETDREEMAGGSDVEDVTVTVRDAYIKRGYCFLSRFDDADYDDKSVVFNIYLGQLCADQKGGVTVQLEQGCCIPV
ncbi:hypothetical protein Bbelb_272510 [Branchiostoma belcheri]|nr:hypothetical protein Bbelb_272510 [Branchiostoma belcheri]